MQPSRATKKMGKGKNYFNQPLPTAPKKMGKGKNYFNQPMSTPSKKKTGKEQ